MKNYILLMVLILIAGLAWLGISLLEPGEEPVKQTEQTASTEQVEESTDVVVDEIREEPIEEVSPIYAEGVMACSDCLLAPVDKKHELSSSYAPTVRTVNVTGGGQLTNKAASALEDLFATAKDDGLSSIYLRSSYRSYATQEATFNKWVNYELNNGAATRAKAEAIANTYSAYPGQSEHQLGTTVDILCSGCDFEFSSANKTIWNWLAENAQSFGFVLSYPEGKEDETGYTYEPWHYRYIGKQLAKEFNQQDKTLNNWLNTPR